MKIALALAVTLGLLAGSATAEMARWSVIPDRSSISMQVSAMGVTQTGRFSDWSNDIRFDPQAPETSQVVIEVQAASLTMGQQDVTRLAVGRDFLDAEHYPSIRFQLRSLEPVAAGRFTARADVTVKDRTLPVVFPVTLDMTDGVARMSGGFVLDRAAYRIGTGGAMNGLIGRDVRVDVSLATRQSAPPGS